MLEELVAQAALAEASGFDGVMISERHGGIPGNMPNPMQVAGWLADATERAWVAPCPVLTPLHPAAEIVETMAWLAVRHPGRVGVGVATGGHELDYELYGLDRRDLVRRFEVALGNVAAGLSGRSTDAVAADPAVAARADAPVPVVSAALSGTAARRAARAGAGLVGSSLLTVDAERRLSERYLEAGGAGARVLIRHVWLGAPPRDAIAAKLDEYRSTAAGEGRSFGSDELIASNDPSEVAERVAAAARDAHKTCVNLRMHVPGITPDVARAQITAVGESVIPVLRRLLTAR
jgi:alkanesulfonate monooxygenase SsuD/methylene tetrahydromethanopterin reductase-like flavin-dependent oxidoreductase (luciferase family)